MIGPEDGRYKRNIDVGTVVDVFLRKDLRLKRLTRGKVQEILTKASYHSMGIIVRLEDGRVGRVQQVIVSTSDEES